MEEALCVLAQPVCIPKYSVGREFALYKNAKYWIISI